MGWGAARKRYAWGRLAPLALSLCCFASGALAQSQPDSAQDLPPRVQIRRLSESPRALLELAAEISTLKVGEPSMVVVAPLEAPPHLSTTLPSDAREALRQELRQNVAAAVPLTKLQVPEALSPAEARTKARRERLPLVLISPSIDSNNLVVVVTVTKWPGSFWRRVVDPKGSTTERLEIHVPSESVRRLFPVAAQVAQETAQFKSPVPGPLALACGDVDASGGQMLAVVGRHAVHLGPLTATGFQTETRRTWSSLSPIHGSPLRAPLGSAVVQNGKLLVGASDRAATLHLDQQMNPLGYSPRGYPIGEGKCLPFSAVGLKDAPFDCNSPSPRSPNPSLDPATSRNEDWEAFAQTHVLTPSGATGTIRAFLPVGSSTLQIEAQLPSEAALNLELSDVGSAIAVADLDGDGNVEIIVSSASESGEPDELRIFSLQDRKLRKLVALEMEPISALAICPFQGQNPLTLAVATGKELWIIR